MSQRDNHIGEERPAKKCSKEKHIPGILSMSNDYFVCEYCDEVFDWVTDGEKILRIVELGDWPGSKRKIWEYRNEK